MKKRVSYSVIGGLLLSLFILLSFILFTEPEALHAIDQTITTIVRFSYPSFNSFFIWYTKLANPLVIVFITGTAFLLLVKKKFYPEAGWLLINFILIAGVANPLLKLVFQRERPTLEHLVAESSFSFPSGHSVTSMIVLGTLIFILPVLIQRQGLKYSLQILLGFMILLMGISRVYLGVHYPSDIIGGFLLGLSWLNFSYPFYRKKRNQSYSSN